ncbi:MAG: ester cyclase [Chloroflexi bacterium]|nr:ester cyclase [Chloroflexota bacterium]
MSAEDNKTIVRGYMEEILNKGNLAAIDNYFDKEGVYFNGKRIEPMQLATFWRRAFPDANLIIEDQIAEGDKVVSRVTMRGTHQGEYYGIAPTGKQVAWTGIAVDRIAGSKVVEMWHEADELGILQQLGVHLTL